MKHILSVLLLLLLNYSTFAQEPSGAFDMRSSGKIYVVVAVLLLVFIGIAVYLFSIDKRLKKIESGK